MRTRISTLLLLLWVTGAWPAFSQTSPNYAWTNFVGWPGVTGSADGLGSAARFSQPWGVAVDSAGNLFVADSGNNTIRKVTPAGAVTTLAGSAGTSGTNDGSGSAARFGGPIGLAVDSAGNLFVEDYNMIRQVTPAGVVTTLAGREAQFEVPWGVAVDSAGNVFVADHLDNTIRKVTSAGVVTTLAGLRSVSGTNDGTGSEARFNAAAGVAVDSAGNVFVVDTGNNTIRKVTSAGVVTTLAGSGGASGTNDGAGSAARFMYPYGVAVDSADDVFVADTINNTIRKVTSAGVVTTIGGEAGLIGAADGISSAAKFWFPGAIAVDSAGNLYVADSRNNRISKGTPTYAPIIVLQPQGQIYRAGMTVAFLVSAIGLDPMSYQWQKNGTNLVEGGTISGSSTSTLTLSTIMLNDAGNYTVVITNSHGGVTSTVATLTVLAAPSIPVPPESQTVLAGSNVLFDVTVEAFPKVSFQWTYNGTNITGATGASLLLTNAQFQQSGSYSVAVTNSIGYAISIPATLTVLAPPQLLSQPANQIGYWGLSAFFQAKVVGTLPFSYQWYFDEFPISWATNSTLDMSDLELGDAGEYSVEVTNLYGSVISDPATLIVNPAGVSLGLYPGLSITGAVGKTFGIQYITNVAATTGWVPITNVTLTHLRQFEKITH